MFRESTKKAFEEPICDVHFFNVTDVLTTSDLEDWETEEF